MSRGSQRGRLACPILTQETTTRAQSVVQTRAILLKNVLNMLFEFASIANDPKKVRTNVQDQCQEHHYCLSDTPLAKA